MEAAVLERREGEEPICLGMHTTGQSRLMILGVGYRFAAHTPITVFNPPWRFLVGQHHGWGMLLPAAGFGDGEASPGEAEGAAGTT